MFPPNPSPDSWRQIEYQAPPPEGIELLLKIRSNEQPQIYLMDESEGLPAIPGWTYPARPADTVSSGDYTWVKKLYRIGGN